MIVDSLENFIRICKFCVQFCTWWRGKNARTRIGKVVIKDEDKMIKKSKRERERDQENERVKEEMQSGAGKKWEEIKAKQLESLHQNENKN